MSKLRVRILSPEAELYNNEADSLHLATESGEMELLPAHTPFIGMIDFCVASVRNGEHIEEYYVRTGNVSIDIDGETVKLLAEDVQEKSNMDVKSLEDYMEFVLERLSEPDRLSKYQMAFLEEQRTGLEKSFTVMKDRK